MNTIHDNAALSSKIARLVEERGWSQDEFARLSNLNRLTVRNIFQNGRRRLHNATISACAHTLGITAADLRTQPLERLILRMAAKPVSSPDNGRRLFEMATQPELLAWLERNPERAAQLTTNEMDELLS